MITQPTDEQTDGYSRLRLLDALAKWGDPRLVEAVKSLQEPLTTSFLMKAGAPRLARPDEPPPPAHNPLMLPHLMLGEAWNELVQSFRTAIETGVLHLEGVEANAAMDREPQAIRGAFAAEFQFDFQLNTVRVRGTKYLAVTVSRIPSAWAKLELGSSEAQPQARRFSAADLTSDQIVELIEEHYRRVVAEPRVKVMPPGTVSLIPVLRMKLRERAARGELMDTLAGEAAWLFGWIKPKLEHQDPPSTATIKRTLGKTYAELKGRSNAAI